MTQLALSTDLQVITAEINSYKQIAGQSVYEIGKRLKHVKENDLAHGQFGEWLDSIDFNHSTANKMMRAYEEFGNSESIPNLGTAKIFEMLSLPESIDRTEFIEQEHTVPSTGESKKVDDMTVKELREVKKALKEAEERARQAEMDRQAAVAQKFTLAKQIEELEKKKTMSLEDKEKLQKLTEENISLNRSIEQIREEYDAKVNKLENDRHAVRKLKESFKNILVTINFEHSQAEYYLLDLMGLKEAHEAIKNFVDRFDEEVLPRIEQWRRVTESKIEQGGSEYVKPSNSARSRVVIDVDPSEESAD